MDIQTINKNGLMSNQTAKEITALIKKLQPKCSEDDVHDIYIKVIRNIPKYDPDRSSFDTYISNLIGWFTSHLASKELLYRDRFKQFKGKE